MYDNFIKAPIRILCINHNYTGSINCQHGQCQNSEFYLAAAINTINCDGNDFCNSLSIQCGEYEIPPSGYTEYDFAGAIHECTLVLYNTMPSNVYMQCHHNVAICQCIGDGCDLIHKLFDVESTMKNDENLSQKSSDTNASGFVYILLFIFIGILLMTFAICCCIRILYEYRRKMIEMQLDQQSHNVNRNESEQILENANVKRSQQPYIVYSCVTSMVTVPSIPIQNADAYNSGSSSILDEQVFIKNDSQQ
eukprot:292621_1